MPAKSKRLTNKEKVLKAKTKKELQKQGLVVVKLFCNTCG